MADQALQDFDTATANQNTGAMWFSYSDSAVLADTQPVTQIPSSDTASLLTEWKPVLSLTSFELAALRESLSLAAAVLNTDKANAILEGLQYMANNVPGTDTLSVSESGPSTVIVLVSTDAFGTIDYSTLTVAQLAIEVVTAADVTYAVVAATALASSDAASQIETQSLIAILQNTDAATGTEYQTYAVAIFSIDSAALLSEYAATTGQCLSIDLASFVDGYSPLNAAVFSFDVAAEVDMSTSGHVVFVNIQGFDRVYCFEIFTPTPGQLWPQRLI